MFIIQIFIIFFIERLNIKVNNTRGIHSVTLHMVKISIYYIRFYEFTRLYDIISDSEVRNL